MNLFTVIHSKPNIRRGIAIWFYGLLFAPSFLGLTGYLTHTGELGWRTGQSILLAGYLGFMFLPPVYLGWLHAEEGVSPFPSKSLFRYLAIVLIFSIAQSIFWSWFDPESNVLVSGISDAAEMGPVYLAFPVMILVFLAMFASAVFHPVYLLVSLFVGMDEFTELLLGLSDVFTTFSFPGTVAWALLCIYGMRPLLGSVRAHPTKND